MVSHSTHTKPGERLPLTTFEHFMWADHRPSYPMHFFLKTVLKGDLHQERFATAVRDATSMHPLVRARIEGEVNKPTSKLSWVVADRSPDIVLFIDNMQDVGKAPALDLRFETGLRVFVAPLDDNHHQVVWQAHHSCTDAIGLLAFVEDVLKIFAGEAENEGLGTARLMAARNFNLPAAERWRRFPRDFKRASRFFVNDPGSVAKPKADKFEDLQPALLHAEEVHFSEAETGTLQSYAKDLCATLNDLLMTAAFMVLADTAYQHPSDGDSCIRIAMPINMRSSRDLLPVANVVSMCFLDRKISQIQTFAGLLQEVADETKDIKQNRMGQTLHEVLRVLGATPYGIKSLAGAKRCLASAVVSNLGAPDLAAASSDAPLQLKRVMLYPPLRPFNYLSFGACTLHERLSLSLHYDHRHITRTEGRQIMADFREYLLENAKDGRLQKNQPVG